MNCRGFAMLSVLWLITALTLLTGGALAAARTGAQASRNRILLAREAWAREACVELLLGRWAKRGIEQPLSEKLSGIAVDLDSVDLGRDTWCSVHLEDPSARLNLNAASGEELKLILGSDSLTDAVLDWRDPDDVAREAGAESSWYHAHHRIEPRNAPFASIDELLLVRGFESRDGERLHNSFTVRGRGVVNLNAAPHQVLRAALHLPEESLSLLTRKRAIGHPVTSLDELISLSSSTARAALASRYQELMARSGFSPAELVTQVEGHVGSSALVAKAAITMVPLPERLAVIRRETE